MKAVIVLLMAISSGLVGCSASPPPIPMGQVEYNAHADRWIAISRCASDGTLSVELAAVGRSDIQYQLNARNYDPPRFGRAIANRESLMSSVTKSTCTDLAIAYAGMKQQIDRNFQINAAEAARAGQAPKTTTCNRFGTMTTCNSY